MAAAVANSGGFGFIPSPRSENLSTFQNEIDCARRELYMPLTKEGRMRNIGCGYLGWVLDSQSAAFREEAIRIGVRSTSAVWLSFGDNLQKWVKIVKEEAGSSEVKLFVAVTTVEQGIQAATWGVDVLIAQGSRIQ